MRPTAIEIAFLYSPSPSLLPLDRNTKRVACVVAFLYTVYEREGESVRGGGREGQAGSRRGRVRLGRLHTDMQHE